MSYDPLRFSLRAFDLSPVLMKPWGSIRFGDGLNTLALLRLLPRFEIFGFAAVPTKVSNLWLCCGTFKGLNTLASLRYLPRFEYLGFASAVDPARGVIATEK